MQDAGYEMGGALTCPHFSRRGREGKGSAVHPLLHQGAAGHKTPQSSPFVPSVNLKPPSNSEYRQERLSRGVVRCKIIVPGSKIFAKKGDLLSGFLLHLLRIGRLIWARRNYERLLDEMCFDGQMCLASVL